MNEHHIECVSKTFIQVLEDVAMMFGDQIELGELPPPAGECVAVSIDFTGPGKGSLKLVTPDRTATEVAANVLGLDAGDPEVQEGGLDALKELINVTLGQLLTEIGGKEAVFDLSPPGARVGVTPSEWREFLAQEGTVAVVADEHPILLGLEMQAGTLFEGGAG